MPKPRSERGFCCYLEESGLELGGGASGLESEEDDSDLEPEEDEYAFWEAGFDFCFGAPVLEFEEVLLEESHFL